MTPLPAEPWIPTYFATAAQLPSLPLEGTLLLPWELTNCSVQAFAAFYEAGNSIEYDQIEYYGTANCLCCI